MLLHPPLEEPNPLLLGRAAELSRFPLCHQPGPFLIVLLESGGTLAGCGFLSCLGKATLVGSA